VAVRKRKWVRRSGEEREAWVADYTDQHGNRRLKTFVRKKEADAYAATTHIEVRDGTHIADSASITVTAAGELWIAKVRQDGRERTTVEQYQQHLKFHIEPYLGNLKLSHLSAPLVRAFEDKLRAGTPAPGEETAEPRSQAMTKKIIGSLGALLAEAQERGLVARNVVRELRSRRKRGKDRRAERREKGKLKVGVDIPTPAEIRAIAAKLEGRWRPLLLTAIFTGLRSSELRDCTCASVPTATRRSVGRNQRPANVPCPSRLPCFRCFVSGSSPALRANSISIFASRTATAISTGT
jgi:integrase